MKLVSVLLCFAVLVLFANGIEISVITGGKPEDKPLLIGPEKPNEIEKAKNDVNQLAVVDKKAEVDVQKGPNLKDLYDTGMDEEEQMFAEMQRRINAVRFRPGLLLFRGMPNMYDEERRPFKVRVTENEKDFVLDVVNIPEEYKKEDFKVDVQTSEEDGNKDVLIITAKGKGCEMVKEFSFSKARLDRSSIKAQFANHALTLRLNKKPLDIVNVKIE
jgi:hypothetical protein